MTRVKDVMKMMEEIKADPSTMTSQGIGISAGKIGIPRNTHFKMKPRTKEHLTKIKVAMSKPETRLKMKTSSKEAHLNAGRGTGALTHEERAEYRRAIKDYRFCEELLGEKTVMMNAVALRRGLNPHFLKKFLAGKHLEDLYNTKVGDK